jgi:hypothetical protein
MEFLEFFKSCHISILSLTAYLSSVLVESVFPDVTTWAMPNPTNGMALVAADSAGLLSPSIFTLGCRLNLVPTLTRMLPSLHVVLALMKLIRHYRVHPLLRLPVKKSVKVHAYQLS